MAPPQGGPPMLRQPDHLPAPSEAYTAARVKADSLSEKLKTSPPNPPLTLELARLYTFELNEPLLASK